jgi:tRNA dimethylallyltransferase
MSKSIITIVGPTGIGKTDLSIFLAKSLKSEIISADSRQFFKEIPIGTAAPSKNDLSHIKHHFIHNKSIKENYSVGQFEMEALSKIRTLHKKYNTLIVVGGSGLYINSILYGLDDFPKIDSKVRIDLNKDLKDNGIEFLQNELKNNDALSYSKIDIKNPHRLIRALEIFRGTGYTYSSFINNSKKQKREFKIINIGLTADRKIIYDRINKRVDKMIENGLIKEAQMVYKYKNLNALKTVGYKELFEYFSGERTLDNAIEEIKKNTRRFAKRQITWFKKQEDTIWFNYKEPYTNILLHVKNKH